MTASIAHTRTTSSSASNNSQSALSINNNMNRLTDPLNNTIIASVLVNSFPYLIEVLQKFIVI